MFLDSQFDDSSLSRIDLARDAAFRQMVRRNVEERLSEDPEDLCALMMLGHVLVAEGEFDEARLRYLQACKVSPSYVPALLNCGAEYIRGEEFVLAEKFFRKAEAERPNSAIISTHIGICRLNQGDSKMAHEMFERAVKLNPKYSPSYLYLAVLADRKGNYREADEHALNAIAYGFEAGNMRIYIDAIAVHQRMEQKLNGGQPEVRY